MEEREHTILIVAPEGDAGDGGLLLQILLVGAQQPGLTPVVLSPGADLWETLGRGYYDAVLLEIDPGDASLVRLRALLRAQPELPVVVVSRGHDRNQIRQAVAAGAHDALLVSELTSAVLSRSLLYAIERQAANAALQRLDRYDSLTGLLAHASLFGVLERLLERRRNRADFRFAVLVLGIDNLHEILRLTSPAFCDDLLVAVARRIERRARPEDTLARLDRNCFALVLCSIGGVADALKASERLQAHLQEPFRIRRRETRLAANLGLALPGPGCEDPHELLGEAVLRLRLAWNPTPGIAAA